MRSKFFVHLRRQWMGALALFLVLAGGTAYAANSVFSEDIVDGEVKSVDIGNNQVRSADVRDDSLAGGGLTGDDIQEATLNTVQGRGTLYSNRMMVAQGNSFKCCLLVTSGLGQIEAGCFSGADFINYRNTTRSTVEVWSEQGGNWFHDQVSSGGNVAVADSDTFAGGTLSVGTGSDFSPRRMATFHGFVAQPQEGGLCHFQAQATLWTSE